jgi:hypothetical protein
VTFETGQEIKRDGRDVGILPNEAVAIRLTGVVVDIHDEWVSVQPP